MLVECVAIAVKDQMIKSTKTVEHGTCVRCLFVALLPSLKIFCVECSLNDVKFILFYSNKTIIYKITIISQSIILCIEIRFWNLHALVQTENRNLDTVTHII